MDNALPLPSMAEDDFDEFVGYLHAREASLITAAGTFAVENTPTDQLRKIEKTTTNEVIRLAARVILYQRGELHG